MRSLFAVLMAMPLCAAPAFGWGCDGHQIVALVARAHLTPAASEAVDKILSSDPISTEHYRYCQDTPTDLMAIAAPWADDRRGADKTSLWHYIDIPRAVAQGDYMKWCEPVGPSVGGKDRPGCIVTAIAYEWKAVRDESKPTPERAAALRYLIHFLGDLSQPLHDTDNFDQGGNCTSIRVPFLDRPANLHSIWDSELVNHEMKQKGLTEMRFAEVLDEEFAVRGKKWLTEEPDVPAWAWEGHAIASSTTYGLLNPPIPVAPADAGLADRAACDLERARIGALKIALDQNYVDTATAVIHEQLAKAGYRLAAVLDETFR